MFFIEDMEFFQKAKDFFMFWRKKEKKEEVKDFRLLKSQAIKELDKIKEGDSKEKTLLNLNRIFRIFINERYELKRSLTYEELNRAITPVKADDKIKKKIVEVSSKIYQSTYKNKSKITKKSKSKEKGSNKKTDGNFNTLLKEIEEIVKES